MSSELLKQTEVLVDQAVLGEQVDSFMRSDIGLYLDQRMQGEYEDAVEKLTQADAQDVKAIQSAQNEIWRARSVRLWLESAIISGLKAQQVLAGREEE
jgi:hypothetical protein